MVPEVVPGRAGVVPGVVHRVEPGVVPGVVPSLINRCLSLFHLLVL